MIAVLDPAAQSGIKSGWFARSAQDDRPYLITPDGALPVDGPRGLTELDPVQVHAIGQDCFGMFAGFAFVDIPDAPAAIGANGYEGLVSGHFFASIAATAVARPSGMTTIPVLPDFDFTTGVLPELVDVCTGGANGTRLNSAGIRVAASAPRFEHDHAGNPLGIMVEGQRTNECTQGVDFNNASWIKVGGGTPTIASDAAPGPDGVNTLTDKLGKTTNAAAYLLKNLGKSAAALPYAASISAKKVVGDYLPLRFQGNGGGNKVDAIVNIARASWSSEPAAVGAFTVPAGDIRHDGNAFSRVELRATTDAHNLLSTMLSVNSQSVVVDQADTTNTSAMLLSYPQIEQAAFASSPIEPGTGAVTRTADDVRSTSVAGWLAATRFIAAWARSPAIGPCAVWELDAAADAANQRITLWLNGQFPTLTVKRNGATEAELVWPYPIMPGEPFKAVVRLENDNLGLSIDGETEITDTACTLPTVDRLLFAQDHAGNRLFGPFARLKPHAY